MASAAVWNRIGICGDWRGHPAGGFSLSTQTFDEMVSTFNREGVHVRWDVSHQSELPVDKQPIGGVPAVGWVTKLERRGTELWGLSEFLPETRKLIQSGSLKYCSPAIRFDSIDPVSGRSVGAKLSSMALTTSPFLKNLGTVQAGDVATGFLCSEIEIANQQPTPQNAARKFTLMTLSLEDRAKILMADRGLTWEAAVVEAVRQNKASGAARAMADASTSPSPMGADTRASLDAARTAIIKGDSIYCRQVAHNNRPRPAPTALTNNYAKARALACRSPNMSLAQIQELLTAALVEDEKNMLANSAALANPSPNTPNFLPVSA